MGRCRARVAEAAGFGYGTRVTRLDDHEPASRPSRYARMNGIGNAILVVDRRGQTSLDEATARRLHGLDGLAFDQMMAIGAPRQPGNAAYVDIFNADGSRAGACGNGTRCVAWYLMEQSGDRTVRFETSGGLLSCRRDEPWTLTADMGPPRLGWHDIPLRDAIEDTRAFALEPHSAWMDALGPCAGVSMGNPHAVFFLSPDTPLPDLGRLGPALERHPMFPDRANISFARALASDHVVLDVWERGAGLTRACGSAACASVVAGVRLGLVARTARVDLPGGTLQIAWRQEDGHVLMSGPVELEALGELVVS